MAGAARMRHRARCEFHGRHDLRIAQTAQLLLDMAQMLDCAADALAGDVLEAAGFEDDLFTWSSMRPMLSWLPRAISPRLSEMVSAAPRMRSAAASVALHHRFQLQPAVAGGAVRRRDQEQTCPRISPIMPASLASPLMSINSRRALRLGADFGEAPVHEGPELGDWGRDLGADDGAKLLRESGGKVMRGSPASGIRQSTPDRVGCFASGSSAIPPAPAAAPRRATAARGRSCT